MPNHSTPGRSAKHTHRNCWVFKQFGKLNAEHKGLDIPSEDDDEPHKQSTGEQKKFPQEVKTVNSKLTSRDKREIQNGAYRYTRHTACPRGAPPLVVTTNHL